MQATLEQYLRETYTSDHLEDLAQDGCNWGGDMTRDLYNEYYYCIWRADTSELSRPIASFANHTDFARYMLSNAVQYYAQQIIEEN